MVVKVSRRKSLLVAAAALAGLFAGCSGANEPKLAEAPTYTPPAKPEPPQAPTRKGQGEYGASDRYQKAMERAAKR